MPPCNRTPNTVASHLPTTLLVVRILTSRSVLEGEHKQVKERVVKGKLALEGTIGDPAVLLQHGHRLAEGFVERHGGSPCMGSLHGAGPLPSIIPDGTVTVWTCE